MSYIFDKLQREQDDRNQNVGFEPGQLGEYPAWFTKMDFQRRLHEQYYGEERINTFSPTPSSTWSATRS